MIGNYFWGGGGAAPYEIEQSLRFNSGDSTYLNRTPGSAGDRTLWTWSAWIKRSGFGSTVGLFGSYAAANNTDYFEILFASGNTLLVQANSQVFLGTSQVFRDPSAWYHIVIAVDTSNATADDRIKLYVNGEQVTAFAIRNNPSSGGNLGINQAALHRLGRRPSGTDYFNGYMAEVNFIDGSALDQYDFGELDDNGVWRPIKYAGSYTGNSFYLKFASGNGTDSSGLSNTWTANNFTTSGTGTDVMSDTPTNNFCTLNPLYYTASGIVQSEGNLKVTFPSAPPNGMRGGTLATTNAFYFEAKATAASSNQVFVGVQPPSWANNTTTYPGKGPDGWGYQASGAIVNNNSTVTTVSSWTAGDIIGVACHPSSGTIEFFKNGTSVYSGTSVANVPMTIGVAQVGGGGNSGTFVVNCGQRAFEYTPPSGFLPLNTSNLPAPDIADGSDYFNTVLYTGNGSTQSITGVGFQPDWVWIKSRSAANSHGLFDAVRGVQNELNSNSSSAEGAGLSGVTSFDSDGFSLGSRANENQSSATFAAWNWLAGNGTSSISAGSIDGTNPTIASTVSANPTAGFSIVSYTGTGAGASVGHGLGVAPSLLLFKNRDSAENWAVWHSALDATTGEHLGLNQTNAVTTNSVIFNSTAPTSTVFSVGNNGRTGLSGDNYIAYCFAEVEGYSKFGTYTGNGSTDGPFVYCGFSVQWLLYKRTNDTEDWVILDNARDTYNPADAGLRPNWNYAEFSNSEIPVDFTSNGFKLRATDRKSNGSGSTYIFAAFAENPFGGSGVSPATAR